MHPNIVFFPVKDISSKLLKICHTAQLHLEKKETLLILVPDQTVWEFIDQLLWKLPEDSFLPHPCSLISIELQPKEDGSALFNLRPMSFLEKNYFKTIYELEDHTSSEKLQLSKQRYQAYRDANYPISFL